MLIKKVIAKSVKDSREKATIKIIVETSCGMFETSAPSGKSRGEYEAKPYFKNLTRDISAVNNLNVKEINTLIIKKFEDLAKLERLVKNKIGANSLFALEASLLKALASENKKELWQFLEGKTKKLPRPICNIIGGGIHSKGVRGKKPDFQEFLFISDAKTIKECIKINKLAHKSACTLLKSYKKNDEGAWETDKSNEEVLEIMNQIQKRIKKKFNENLVIGVDVAGSSFFKKNYDYKNPKRRLSAIKQIESIKGLVKGYGLYYVEDPLDEDDFSGFKELNKEKCFIVGDDLTATNPSRLKKAIRMKSINAVIVKPNQIGSLLKVKEVIGLAKKAGIKTIISHRSGETEDDTIADLAVGWGCDFIKTGIYGNVRESKLKRLVEIEKRLKR